MTSKNDLNKQTLEELAQALGVSKSIIRFWEDEFELPKRENGVFSRLQIAEIQLIHKLVQEQDLTLEDAKIAFAQQRVFLEKKYETIDTLEKIKGFLTKIKAQMD